MSNVIYVEAHILARTEQINHLIKYVSSVGHQFFQRKQEPKKGDVAFFVWNGKKIEYFDEIGQRFFDILDENNYHLFSHGHTLRTFITACARYINYGDIDHLSRIVDACDSLGLWSEKGSTSVIVAQWAATKGLYVASTPKKGEVTDGDVFKALGRFIDACGSGVEVDEAVVHLHCCLRWKWLQLNPKNAYVFEYKSKSEIMNHAHLISQHTAAWHNNYSLLIWLGSTSRRGWVNTVPGKTCLSYLKSAIECLVVAQWT